MAQVRMLLTLKHYGRDGQLLETRQQWSRSWLKHFIEGLYLLHAQIQSGAPYTPPEGDIRPHLTLNTDVQVDTVWFPKMHMQASGPCGDGGLFACGGGVGSAGTQPEVTEGSWIPGYNIGIVVGTNNAAVTPTQSDLGSRISHGVNGPVGVAASIDSILTGDDTNESNGVANGMVGMVFIPKRNFICTRVDFRVWRSGNPGNVTAQIVGVDGASTNNVATDNVALAISNVVNANLWLNASPGQFETFTFPAPIMLKQGAAYYIFITPSYISAGNSINMRVIAGNPSGHNRYCEGAGLGNTLTAINEQCVYDLWGTAEAQFEHGATDIYGFSAVNPNASFVMRRIFMNNSGGAISIVEAGILLPFSHYISSVTAMDFNSFIFLAARDTFAAINVLNGESLEVDYTPSITV